MRRLTAEQTPAFEHMTFPARKHLLSLQPSPRLLREASQQVQPWAFGAYDEEGKPAALALLLAPPDEEQIAEILSLFVQPAHRRRGVGTAMLKAIEPLIRASGVKVLRAVYTAGKSYTPIIERIFESCSWREPHLRMLFYRIRIEDMEHVTGRLSKPRRGFEISPWSEVPKEDRRKLVEQPWAQMQITPKVDVDEYDPRMSMALRYHGELVGWAMVEGASDEMIRVPSTYVRPDLARTAALIPVLAKCAETAWQLGYRKATFTGVPSHAQLMHFANRRMAPHCYSIVESRGAERHFSDD